MTMARGRFICPKCGRGQTRDYHVESFTPINCGECLFEHIEVVELVVDRVRILREGDE